MSALSSMTGFASLETNVGRRKYRAEVRSLNHRYLDLKVRLPRELSIIEIPIRKEVDGFFKRGAVDLRIEKLDDLTEDSNEFEPNLAIAAHYFEALKNLQKTLGLTDEVKTSDILSFPDVISRTRKRPYAETSAEEAYADFQPLVQGVLKKLQGMRDTEGKTIHRSLSAGLEEMASLYKTLQDQRKKQQKVVSQKIRDKIESLFQTYPIQGGDKTLLETRIAQELAIVMDRMDVEEEMNRFQGHLEHFKEHLTAKGPVGRKLEFLIQEMNREMNTLANKAQHFEISQTAVQVKVVIEQLREQVLNAE